MYEIELVGGRYDGMAFPVLEKIWYSAIVFLAEPSKGKALTQKTTDDGWEGHFYYPDDWKEGGSFHGDDPIEDESVYYRCADNTWRPWKLKQALGL